MTEPHTIARVIARTNVGGPALQVVALMRGIDPARYPQYLLRGRVADGEADYLELRAADVSRIDVPGLGRSVKPLDDLRALWFLIRFMRRVKPTIVHTHTAKAGVLGRVAAIVARVPIRVHTFHGHLLHGYFSPRVTKAIVLVERLLARATTHTVVVGEQVRDDLVKARIVRLSTSTVVAPGVQAPTSIDADGARRALGLGAGSVVVTFVARFTSIKRVDRLVEVARELTARCADVEFLVVGDGPDRELIEAAGLPRIRCVGWQSNMSQVYAASDVVLLTSDNEGMPVALIEAARHGVPAVTTDVGSVRQVVIDGVTGFVTDPSGLVPALRRLVDQPDLRGRFGAAAARHAEERFSEDRLVSDYVDLYDALVGGSRRRRAN